MAKNFKMIGIDLEIHQLIEVNRSSFGETENDILRRILGLQSQEHQRTNSGEMNIGYGVVLPESTRVRGKGMPNSEGEVKGGWFLYGGKRYKRPSGVARAIRGYSENGWRFLEVKRPQDSEWVILDNFRDQKSIRRRRVGAARISLSEIDLADFPEE